VSRRIHLGRWQYLYAFSATGSIVDITEQCASVDTGTLDSFKQFVAEHPYTGNAEQVATLSMGLAEAAMQLDRSTYTHYRQETGKELGINDKVLSKLKVIGETLLKIDEKQRREIIKKLPSSYSTIHILCSLRPEELITAVKNGAVTPKLSSRSADIYVKQVRFPRQFLQTETEGIGTKEQHHYSIMRPENKQISEDEFLAFEKTLRSLCEEYGLVLRKVGDTSNESLRKQERAEREIFWREVLEKELSQEWFEEMPDETKKQFNLRTRDELIETPLRSFTGFLNKTSGGRNAFWEKHGRAYVAKVHLLQEKTDNNAQRYNFKRRLEEVFEERKELAVWRNQIVKLNMFVY
jgi:hypothetical protein